MPKFSGVSEQRLVTCDVRLQRLFREVVASFDCVVLCGERGQDEQSEAVRSGKSQTPWPKSKHNVVPPETLSKAVDVGPFDRPDRPVDWQDRERITLFAGFVLGVARGLGISVRWGGDWDRDTVLKDNSFDDLVHYELVD